MENNSTKVEMMKPIFLKAGVPLAITLGAYIIAKITTRKSSISVPSEIQENPHEVSRNEDIDDSKSLSCDDHSSTNTLYQDSSENFNFQEDQLEAKFQHYTHLKNQEIAIMDMQNKLLQEINKIDFLCKEITLMERESQRFQNLVVEYLGIMELLELSQSENKLLHRKVKKHLKNIKKQKFQLEAKETEISRNNQMHEMKDHTMKNMEIEIQQLKMAIEQLHEEKAQLLSKLELAEISNPSKKDVELVTIEDYKELVKELEQVQKDKANEDKELIYLRWCNACLRHELMRKNQEQMEQEKPNQELNLNEEIVAPEHELIMRRSSSVGHHESCLSSPIGGHSNDHFSKRKKIIQKFKKWVEGSDKMKHETNCFKRHYVSNPTEELILDARRNSCSSA